MTRGQERFGGERLMNVVGTTHVLRGGDGGVNMSNQMRQIGFAGLADMHFVTCPGEFVFVAVTRLGVVW